MSVMPLVAADDFCCPSWAMYKTDWFLVLAYVVD